MAFALAVEDDPVTRMVHLQVLQQLGGVTAVGAATLSEARELCRVQCPDILVLDRALPDGSGLDLLGELLRAPRCTVVVTASLASLPADLPVGVYTAEKPVAPDTLLQLLRRHSRSRLSDGAKKFSPSEFLQLTCMGRHSADIVCRDRDGQVLGSIYVLDGQLWAAHDARGEGQSAFTRLVGAQDVSAVCHPLGSSPTRNIDVDWQHLLLDAARIQDEAEHRALPAVGRVDLDDLLRQGAKHVLNGELAEAASCFRQASEVNPDHPVVQHNMKQFKRLGFSVVP